MHLKRFDICVYKSDHSVKIFNYLFAFCHDHPPHFFEKTRRIHCISTANAPLHLSHITLRIFIMIRLCFNLVILQLRFSSYAILNFRLFITGFCYLYLFLSTNNSISLPVPVPLCAKILHPVVNTVLIITAYANLLKITVQDIGSVAF